MTPLSAELIAAPAALMVLLAMMWLRRNRGAGAGAGAHHPDTDSGFDQRLSRFVSAGRRSGKNRDVTPEDVQATGVFTMPEGVGAPPASVAQAHAAVAATSVEDAVFGPSTGDGADEPDWEAMRHPQRPVPPAPEDQSIAEVSPQEAAEVVHEEFHPEPQELITRPGWPLPGDLDAWENSDLEPLVGTGVGDPSGHHWAELAAEGPLDPFSQEGVLNGHQPPADHEIGSEAIVLGGPYPGPGLAPPDTLSDLTAPSQDRIGQSSGQPGRTAGDASSAAGGFASPSADPSFWAVSGADVGGAQQDFDATHPAVVNGSDAWPPEAPSNGEDWWGNGAASGSAEPDVGQPQTRERPGTNALAAGVGSFEDWWTAESTSPGAQAPNGLPHSVGGSHAPSESAEAVRELGGSETRSSRPGDLSGMQRPELFTPGSGPPVAPPTPETPAAAGGTGDAWWGDSAEPRAAGLEDWWSASGTELPQEPPRPGGGNAAPEMWSNTSGLGAPHAAPVATTAATAFGAPQTAATVGEILGAAPVATPGTAPAASQLGPRVLPRLDASVHNRNTSGRFAVGGSAVAAGDGAFTRVRFRAALQRPILGWAIGDGPHHAPGTLVLVVDAILNCSTAGLSVLQEDGDPNRPDGFTLSLSSDGPGPFAVSGSFYVVTG